MIWENTFGGSGHDIAYTCETSCDSGCQLVVRQHRMDKVKVTIGL